MRLGEYSKRYGLRDVTGLPNFSYVAQYFGQYISGSPIRMKLAVKDSLYLFSPMKVVASRYLV